MLNATCAMPPAERTSRVSLLTIPTGLASLASMAGQARRGLEPS